MSTSHFYVQQTEVHSPGGFQEVLVGAGEELVGEGVGRREEVGVVDGAGQHGLGRACTVLHIAFLRFLLFLLLLSSASAECDRGRRYEAAAAQ